MIYKHWVRKNLLLITTQVVFWMIAIMMFFQVLGQIKFMNASYNLYKVCIYVSLLVPRDIYRMYPIIAVLIMFIFLSRVYAQQLHRNWYFLSLRPQHLMSVVGMFFCISTLAVFAVGEFVAPAAEHMAKKIRVEALFENRLSTGMKDMWLKEPDGYSHAYYAKSTRELVDVERFIYKDGKLKAIYNAEKAVYENGHWLMKLVTVRDFTGEDIKQTSSIQSLPWSIDISPSLLEMAQLKPEYRSIISFSRLFMMSDFYGVFVASDQVILVTRLMKPIVIMLSIWMMLYALMPLSMPSRFVTKLKVTVLCVALNVVWVYLASTFLSTWSLGSPSLIYIVLVGLNFYVWKSFVDKRNVVMDFMRRKLA